MVQISAGLLMYRKGENGLEFLLVHPGGPFFANKDEGSWSIPKGLLKEGEDNLDAAKREFEEETGLKPSTDYIDLGNVTLKSGKVVHAWAFEGDADPREMRSNTFTVEWPPKSGTFHEYPENDRFEFFTYETAAKKLNSAQVEFLDRLLAIVPIKK